MPEYVYALHDFHPENPDEVPFKVGEKIEVVEKDDLYGDGWWQVSMSFRHGRGMKRHYIRKSNDEAQSILYAP